MNIIIAKTAGFCSGVQRGIGLIEKALAAQGKPLYALNFPVHNAVAVSGLIGRGLKFLNSLDGLAKDGALLIGTHGACPEVYAVAQANGIEIVDATCPMVKRVQRTARMAAGHSDMVIIVGNRNHTEVKSVCEWAGTGKALVIESVDDVRNIPRGLSLAIVSQTTFSCREFGMIVDFIRKSAASGAIEVFRTICPATFRRQEEVRELAGIADKIFIIGDSSSANSLRLVETALFENTPAKLVSSSGEITAEDLEGVEILGISAGASTPDEVIRQCKNKIITIADNAHVTSG
ncbi:MAG: 4-hydroxy-3-methylbut-2-enyl diphosphate reductase [Planctomycetes bacterium]|nr:4-hydroxy-3-methylbut-2-enyl diphosphate reductase [Planctomycetota bacterium]